MRKNRSAFESKIFSLGTVQEETLAFFPLYAPNHYTPARKTICAGYHRTNVMASDGAFRLIVCPSIPFDGQYYILEKQP